MKAAKSAGAPFILSAKESATSTPATPADQDAGAKGGGWTVEGVKKIIEKTDPQVTESIRKDKIEIISFDTAYDKWKYDDGRVKENEIKGLRGNTVRADKQIRLRKSMSNEEAAKTLFHEMGHMKRKPPKTRDGYLQEEIDVRVETEEFAIRQGMPPTGRGYRTKDGKVDRAAIEKQIKGSSHYNPKGRKRIDRRYVDEKKTTGW